MNRSSSYASTPAYRTAFEIPGNWPMAAPRHAESPDGVSVTFAIALKRVTGATPMA
jgi:predicted transcriptional regulator